jgi:hypothetical protein
MGDAGDKLADAAMRAVDTRTPLLVYTVQSEACFQVC